MSVGWYVVLEREIPGFDHTVNGKAVAKAADQLDLLAAKKNVPGLMSFFSAPASDLENFASEHGISPQKAAPERWFSASDGLKTLNALIEGTEDRLGARVVAELQQIKEVLETAKRHKIKWHLAVDF